MVTGHFSKKKNGFLLSAPCSCDVNKLSINLKPKGWIYLLSRKKISFHLWIHIIHQHKHVYQLIANQSLMDVGSFWLNYQCHQLVKQFVQYDGSNKTLRKRAISCFTILISSSNYGFSKSCWARALCEYSFIALSVTVDQKEKSPTPTQVQTRHSEEKISSHVQRATNKAFVPGAM